MSIQNEHCLRSLISLLVSLWLSFDQGFCAEPPITSIAFPMDGESVLVGSQRGVVELGWPALNHVRELPCDVGNLHQLVFSPDGRKLGVAGGTPAEAGAIEIVSWPAFTLERSLREHSDSVMAMDWIDNERIVSAALDHQIILSVVRSGATIGTLSGHSKGVTALSVIRNGNLLVSAGIDQNLRVWDFESGTLIRSMNNHTMPVHAIALRPGEQPLAMLASASQDRTIRLWQPTIGRMVRFVRLPAVPLDIAWLNDGSKLAVACDDGRIRIIAPDTVAIDHDLPAIDGWAYALAVHPSDHSILVGGSDGQLKRIQLSAHEPAQ